PHAPRARRELGAIHAARQIDVGEKNVHRRSAVQVIQRRFGVGHRVHGKSMLTELLAYVFADQCFVFNEQYTSRFHRPSPCRCWRRRSSAPSLLGSQRHAAGLFSNLSKLRTIMVKVPLSAASQPARACLKLLAVKGSNSQWPTAKAPLSR